MTEFFNLISGYNFLQNALLAAILASLACGIVGTLVVSNRLSFLAGGASHAAYGGIGIAFHWQLPVLPCTLLFSLLASMVMARMSLSSENGSRENNENHDAQIGVLWAAGMAVGIILIDLTPGYAGELMGFLFGSIITVPAFDLALMAIFNALLLIIMLVFRQGLWAISVDREFAMARGLPVKALFLLLVGITALTSVMLIRIVGLILVLALLTIPPLIARRFCNSIYQVMCLSCLLSLFFCLSGLFISWHTDISSGASIIAVATAAYFSVNFLGAKKNKG